MNAIRNSYSLSKVAVWLSAGSQPSITVASAMVQVDELSYRTAPARNQLVARHISRVGNIKTIPVDRPMLDRVRSAMSLLSHTIHNEADEFITRGQTGSEWLFQPRQDGWFAMFHGRPKDVHAFHHWLCEIIT